MGKRQSKQWDQDRVPKRERGQNPCPGNNEAFAFAAMPVKTPDGWRRDNGAGCFWRPVGERYEYGSFWTISRYRGRWLLSDGKWETEQQFFNSVAAAAAAWALQQ